MRTLDRYVAGLYIKVWFICVLGAPLLFIVIKLTDDLDKYLARGLSIQQVLLAHVYDFPYQMGLSFPVASLFGAVFTVALMSRNFEVTAAKASGISFYRLIGPLVVLGIVLSLAGLALGELVPITNRLRAETLEERGSVTTAVRNQFVYGADGGRAYKIRRLNAETGVIRDILIEREGTGPDYPTYSIHAPAAEWDRDSWVLTDGYLHYYPQPGRVVTFSFDTLHQPDFTESPRELQAEPKDPEEMNFRELGRFIQSIQRSGGDARQLIVQQMLKIAFPMACLIVVLFGSALGMSTGSRGPATGVGIALATVLVYLLTVRISEGMGAGGVLPPVLAAWLPNLLFLVIGLILLVRTRT
ncbi:MAG: YjgP/YjgQ family permease [Gemmatimonadetes bacterium]|uniref:YjgP/YjgQ family permease n=1 Tax=Candidatus Kutchimonas denitrificans TaxID=3056748 RepID=A0AAE5C7S5_9BACT|nr:YjgP/YjgQ family permease [Gemmatimonadota bacterium]NIR73786.1 YjgP/YjgQ family permease [Candidatus Kutchimonas denitrificans]NIS03150.1 YjgP/YjgQ family permease [Gemmatimonadota bacterium]NIT69051.1 YjgP/YjgQ family permease [Gemmatimonadota bacterium]NIU54142.1 LptF/LptG family permease [Gemmatimonadota bacterium]